MTKPYLTGSPHDPAAGGVRRNGRPGQHRDRPGDPERQSGGTDTALFSGPRADYDITFAGNRVTVTHARGGATDGTDTVTNVERLRFTDETVAVLAPAAPTIGTATAAATARRTCP